MSGLLLENLVACPRCRASLRFETKEVVCTGCSARFPLKDGIPCLADGARDRDERLAAEYEAQSHAHPLYVDEMSIANHWERLVLPQLAREIEGQTRPVLDVGCGVGHLGRALVDAHVRAELVGMDFHERLLSEAKVGYAARVEGDIHRLPFRDDVFGVAIASNTLHHLAEPHIALREISRVLVPGGYMLAYDPRELAPLELVKRTLRRSNPAFTQVHRAFKVTEYRELFEEAGFVVDELRTRDSVAPLVAASLDLVHAGRLHVAPLVSRALAGVDSMVGRLDRGDRFGLMLLARARKPERARAARNETAPVAR